MIGFWQIPASCFLYGFGSALLAIAGYMRIRKYRSRSVREEMALLEAEIMKATQAEVDAMRTLSSFRREYHDGTGALVKEAHKLAREVARLKTAIKEQGIPKSAVKQTGPIERSGGK